METKFSFAGYLRNILFRDCTGIILAREHRLDLVKVFFEDTYLAQRFLSRALDIFIFYLCK